MKTIINILIFGSALIYSLTGCAQTLRNKIETKGTTITYKIKYEKGSKNFEVLRIDNGANSLSKQKQVLSERAKTLFADSRLLNVNWTAVKKIIANSISKDKLEANKSTMIYIHYYFNDQGLLKEVTFGLDPKSTFDGRDLEIVEKNLVNKIQGTIKDDAYKGTNYISLAEGYPFEVLLKIKDL